LGAPTNDVLEVTGRPAEDFETIARRYAGLPRYRRTLGNRLRELAMLLVAPFSPGFNLKRYDPVPRAAGNEDTKMTVARLLRIDAVIFLLFAAGHWFFSPWVIGVDGHALEALSAAAKSSYPVFGFMRSYWDFHVGFGHMAGVTFVMEAALLWFLAAIADGASSIKRLLGVLVIANIATAALQVAYFFWPPIILSVLATVILAMAWLRARGE
jgi:hypothetical protein